MATKRVCDRLRELAEADKVGRQEVMVYRDGG